MLVYNRLSDITLSYFRHCGLWGFSQVEGGATVPMWLTLPRLLLGQGLFVPMWPHWGERKRVFLVGRAL